MRSSQCDRSICLRSEETVAEPGRHVPYPISPHSCLGHRARITTRLGFTKEKALRTALVVVGIDVANAYLDIAVRPSGELFRVPHDPTGITAMIARLSPLRPTRIVLEATGGLERAVGRALVEAALRWNPSIRTFYQRLRAAGKAPKVALVAAMRKLLTILNAMVHHGTRGQSTAEVAA